MKHVCREPGGVYAAGRRVCQRHGEPVKGRPRSGVGCWKVAPQQLYDSTSSPATLAAIMKKAWVRAACRAPKQQQAASST